MGGLLGPCWAPFRNFFVFFPLVGCIFRHLVFLTIFGDFFCISEGFWKVLGGLGVAPGLYLRRFCVHARLRGRNALNVTKPQF